MKKKILYIISSVLLLFGFAVFAQSGTFEVDELFFTQTGLQSGDLAPLHFKFSGNDFAGFLILGDLLNQTGEIELNEESISCQKQLKGLYYNPARGNRMRPLDGETLNTLSGNSNFDGYGDLTMIGGLFTDCEGSDSDNVYGYIKHTYNGIDYEMWAGLDFNLNNGSPISQFSGTFEYIDIPNKTAQGYLFDKNGGTAQIHSTMGLYGDAIFTGSEINWDPDPIITGTQVKIRIFSNKAAQYTITGHLATIYTGTINAGEYLEVPVTLPGVIETQELIVEIYTEEESVIKNLSIEIFDDVAPTVGLVSPNNNAIINQNTLTLKWTGSDNVGISHYDLYLNGMGVQYSWSEISGNIYEQEIWNPLLNGVYTWYLRATDVANNTGQSQTWIFTISGDVLGPTLISPENNASVSIGELALLWEPLSSAISGYIRQISNNINFTNIVSSGHTNSTGVNTIIHHPEFMTGEFFWRVIDQKTAGVSETRKVNISDYGINLSTQVEQFNFPTITGANLSTVYTSSGITITGLTNNVAILAKLENNIGALFVNDTMIGSQYLVKNNDQIRIEMISSNQYYTGVMTKLIIGTGNSLVSGNFEIYTKTGVNISTGNGLNSGDFSLPYALRIQAILLIDSLSDMYKHSPEKWATFLTTFKSILNDRISILITKINQASNDNERSFLEIQKDSLDYLYFVVDEYLRNIDYSQYTIYTAPNCKQYLVEFDDDRLAYTSPNFLYVKYFPTWTLFTRHIDVNNPGNCYTGSSGDTITTPNNKTYIITLENGKRTSNNMKYKKYFDSREELINYIIVNNPSETWDHTIDSNFEAVVFVAPNGKSYSIFKTSSNGNNANKYSSFMFVSPKYFNSLDAAKNHIRENNK